MSFATLAAHSICTGLSTERYHKFRLIIHLHIPMVPPRHTFGPSSCSEMVIGCLHTTT